MKILRCSILFFTSILILNGIDASSWARTQCGPGNIPTRWANDVDPTTKPTLPEYPRPQLVRGDSTTWKNLNGIWQFQPATKDETPPFGKTLNSTILVPFPVEACLSGIGKNYQYIWYRLIFDRPFSSNLILLHFGAIDWQSTIYLNTKIIGNHTGGYDSFTIDITNNLVQTNNELLIYVYDPSETGAQPNGKQFINAINNPGSDVFTPATGIWQTVWLENVPTEYILSLKIDQSYLTQVIITVNAITKNKPVDIIILDSLNQPVTSVTGQTGITNTIPIPNPKLWSPDNPYLYNVKITLLTGDEVNSYFGLRTFTLGERTFSGVPRQDPLVGTRRATGGGTSSTSITIGNADPHQCVTLCENSSTCIAWTYEQPACGSQTVPKCILLTGDTGLEPNTCTWSGRKAIPSRTVKTILLNGQSGPSATGPQQGIDRPGYDLPGYPINLTVTDGPNVCENLCTQTIGCLSWAYGLPSCNTNNPNPLCYLKNGYPAPVSNVCRVSGSGPKSLFLSGWFDHSYWPDGIYTAPTDEALLFDLQAVKTFGMNTIRLHQKVNPERWYYWADKLGILIFQGMPQKYGSATPATVDPFMSDLTAMITGPVANHPSVVQWEPFNEDDCWKQFNVSSVLNYIKTLDNTRLIDVNSGGGANDLHLGDVNDLHGWPYPGDPFPTSTQYGYMSEWGGLGAFIDGHVWVPGGCFSFWNIGTPQYQSDLYLSILQSYTYTNRRDIINVITISMMADVEEECDGFFTYDRLNKFNNTQITAIKSANDYLLHE